MRANTLIQTLSVAAIAAVGGAWMSTRATCQELKVQRDALAAEHASFQALLNQRDALRAELAEAKGLGTWRSARDWSNAGQTTPRAALETLLWAAATGDTPTMMSVLALDDGARVQAQALLERLPASARDAASTPEALIAGLTIKAVPATAAQLSWLHQRDPDHATLGVLLRASAPITPPPGANLPPGVPPRSTHVVMLTARRSAQGWSILVPAAAVKHLGRNERNLALPPNHAVQIRP